MKLTTHFLILLLFLFSTLYGADGDADPIFLTGEGVSAPVNEFLLDPDGSIIAVGDFTSVVGLKVGRICRLNSDGGLDLFFNASGVGANNSIYSITRLPDGKMLIAGSFTSYNGVLVNRIARLFPDGTLDPTFTPGTGANSTIYKVIVQPDTKIIIAGGFSTFNGFSKPSVARISYDGVLDQTFTRSPLIFFNSPVHALGQQADGKLIIGGLFYTQDDINRNIARLDTSGNLDATFVGTTNDFSQTPTSSVLIKNDGKIVIGGGFSTVNGVPRSGVALLNQNGFLEPLTFADVQGSIRRIGIQPDGKYLLAGNSNGLDGRILARRHVDGSVDPLFITSENGGIINSVLFSNNGIYLAGSLIRNPLTSPGASPAAVRRLSYNGSRDNSFITKTGAIGSGGPSDIVVQPDGKITFMVGVNSVVGGYSRTGLARLNSDGTIDESYSPSISGTALVGLPDGSSIVGGIYDPNDGFPRFFKRVLSNGTIDPNFSLQSIPPSNAIGNNVSDMATQADGKVIVVGDYISIGGVNRKSISRIRSDGSIDTTFNPNLVFNEASIQRVRIAPNGKIWINGTFDTGIIRNSIHRMGESGIIEISTQYGGEIIDIAPTNNGMAYVCGNFVSILGNTAFHHIARIDVDGSIDTTFVSPSVGDGNSTTYVVTCFAQPDGKVVIGGTFPSVSGVSRRGIARLNVNGSLDTTYNPGFNDQMVGAEVRAHAFQPDGKIVVGGNFFFMGNVPRRGIARILGPRQVKFSDFDGDGKTDLSIFRPNGAASEWWWLKSSNGGNGAVQFGSSTDSLAPVDFTGDGKTDVAFWRPSTGQWFVLRSEDFSFYAFPFGATGDVPVPADYDGDGKADAAVFRESSVTWYINRSSGGTDIVGFGAVGDKPVNADYDGDGKADIAIYRPNGPGGAEWWVRRSSNASVFALQFGSSTDKAVQGDFTGDGKADVAFWRPSTGFWNVLRSEDFSYYAFPFGANGDIASPGDYDGDGKLDAAVFRPSSATWFANRSTAGTLIQQFGAAGDIPVPSAFVR